jgi:hypothetical protein
LEEASQLLNPAYIQATAFVEDLKNTSAKHTKKLTSLCGRPAPDMVEDLANGISNLIHSSYQVALKTCSTQIVSKDHIHYNPQPKSRKRCALIKKLNHVKYIQSHLLTPSIDSQSDMSSILEHNKENEALCKAIRGLRILKPCS